MVGLGGRCTSVTGGTQESEAVVATPDPGRTGPIRVFVLDDHAHVHVGIGGLLRATPDLVVVGEASSAAEALEVLPTAVPDLALLDIGLPDGSGIDVGRAIRSRYPGVVCLMLTSHDDEEAHLAAVMAGAAGYLIKQIQGPTIVDSIRRAAAGETLLDPEATAQLLDRLRGSEPAAAGPLNRGRAKAQGTRLSEREQTILDLAVAGRTDAEIAAGLKLAEDTVARLMSVIFTKLSLERRVQAAVRAHRSRTGTRASGSSSITAAVQPRW